MPKQVAKLCHLVSREQTLELQVCPTAAPQAGFGGGSRRPSCQVRLSKSGRKNRGMHIKTDLDKTIKRRQGAQTGTCCTRPRQHIIRGAPQSCQGARWARARSPGRQRHGPVAWPAAFSQKPHCSPKQKSCTARRLLTTLCLKAVLGEGSF